MKFTHPCPVTDCTATLEGDVELKSDRAATVDEFGNPVLNIRPQFPVDWTEATQQHIETHRG